MKPCEQCQVVGELLQAEYKDIGAGAIQTLDVKLKCATHGEYEGNWTAEEAKKICAEVVHESEVTEVQ